MRAPARVAALVAAAGLAERVGAQSESTDRALAAFERFISEHERSYVKGSVEHADRLAIFRRRLAAIEAHNADPSRSWTKGVNHFTDRSDDELSQVLGYKPSNIGAGAEHSAATMAGELTDEGQARHLVDWRNLTIASQIPDQGSCGSCWAVTTASVLDAHHEIYMGKAMRFSAQELVSCVQNPKHCGGKGGCDGATVELGMDYALKKGLSTLAQTPYKGEDAPCGPMQMPVLAEDVGAGGHAFGLVGFRKLPTNKELPLVRALVEQGPVAISVAANDWFSYKSGIFNGCAKDVVVDHAVTLYGIGKEGDKTYWLIRNSWGGSWGERGFIRMARSENEDGQCGWDNDPAKGVGCDGGPSRVRVCGTCGILFDNVVPTFNRTMATSGSTQSKPTHKKASDGDDTHVMPVLQESAGAAAMSELKSVQRHDAQSSLMRRES